VFSAFGMVVVSNEGGVRTARDLAFRCESMIGVPMRVNDKHHLSRRPGRVMNCMEAYTTKNSSFAVIEFPPCVSNTALGASPASP